MANFCYKAISAKGKTVRGLVEADTERQAIASVREKGLVPLSVESASASVANPGMPSSKSSFKKILESLHPVPKTASPPWPASLPHCCTRAFRSTRPCEHLRTRRRLPDAGHRSRLRDRIMAGGDLADGLAEFPNVFSSTFVTMVRAGEASGTLELVIERFAEHIEQQVALVRKVQATLAYPILMLFVGIGVVIFLLTFVIPKVTQIFSDMGRALPVPTQILLAVSDGIRSGWWIILLLVLCIMIGVWRMRRTEGGKRYAHRLLLRLPGIAGIYRPLIVGHMTRTLGMLLKNGVTLLKALHIVKSVADNKLMAQAVQNMIDGVQAGRDLSEFMNDPLVFPPLSRQMVAAGERSGQLGEMLLWVANDSENRVASRLQVVTSLMEPVMILLLGGIVGFVVIAIILPIFEMSTLAG
ncbi:MAG: type II secretion system F family protein [Bilophila wadsworthia]